MAWASFNNLVNIFYIALEKHRSNRILRQNTALNCLFIQFKFLNIHHFSTFIKAVADSVCTLSARILPYKDCSSTISYFGFEF